MDVTYFINHFNPFYRKPLLEIHCNGWFMQKYWIAYFYINALFLQFGLHSANNKIIWRKIYLKSFMVKFCIVITLCRSGLLYSTLLYCCSTIFDTSFLRIIQLIIALNTKANSSPVTLIWYKTQASLCILSPSII